MIRTLGPIWERTIGKIHWMTVVARWWWRAQTTMKRWTGTVAVRRWGVPSRLPRWVVRHVVQSGFPDSVGKGRKEKGIGVQVLTIRTF